MITALRWHVMLGGGRLREVTVWLDSEARRRLYQDTAEEVLGLGDPGQLYVADVGLPVEGVIPTGHAATFLDVSTEPRASLVPTPSSDG